MPLDVAPRQRGPADRPPRDPQRLRAADDARRPTRGCCGCGRTSGRSCSRAPPIAGGQRYAALWPGDNVSDWTRLRGTIPMLLGHGPLGLPVRRQRHRRLRRRARPPSSTRAGCRPASSIRSCARTRRSARPTRSRGRTASRHEALNRRAIELRYELLPHIYNVMRRGERDRACRRCGRCSSSIPTTRATYGHRRPVHVRRRPAGRAGAARGRDRARASTCPKGDWYDFWTGRAVRGRRGDRACRSRWQSIPIFVRGGAFVFRQPVVQHTGEMPGQPLRVTVYPAAASERWLYEDDGATMGYEKGQFVRRRFAQQRR